MRTYRQRKVITALINKAKRTPLTKLIAIMRDIFPLITTDLSPLEITGLAYKGGMSMLLFDIEQAQVRSRISAKRECTTANGPRCWISTRCADIYTILSIPTK